MPNTKIIGTSYRLVVRFKEKDVMKYWENFFKDEDTVRDQEVLHVETRVKEDVEEGD